ncbi:hypothetical protein FRUB_04010 [Fimbriiglobus ruber]|uniref:Uncharacterized protein n=1 Tax=Fimbriiglobus ruber TaxID=1908690 RepID=A0A225DKJ9_9BACT|nr:hypothetical protein FRUB_04010 [Fimbriiglobus ruber]
MAGRVGFGRGRTRGHDEGQGNRKGHAAFLRSRSCGKPNESRNAAPFQVQTAIGAGRKRDSPLVSRPEGQKPRHFTASERLHPFEVSNSSVFDQSFIPRVTRRRSLTKWRSDM